MGAFLRGVVLGVVGLALVIQFIRPARTNPPTDPARTLDAAVPVPPRQANILSRACMDCHSNQTLWPWYSNFAPISWFVIDHVNEGRRHMNLSEWLRPGIDDPPQYTRQKFRAACNRVKTGNMPLPSYVLLHPSARLSPADVDAICDWADSLDQGN